MDDLNLDLDSLQDNVEQKLQVKDRFAKLTEKGIEAERKAQEAETKANAEAERASKAERDLQFYKSFSQISSKHPEATNYQDQILERVNKGMDTEEATVAVLYKEGKLNYAAPQQDLGQITGGSAPNTPGIEKDFHDMNLEEKRVVMNELEKTGELERLLTKR